MTVAELRRARRLGRPVPVRRFTGPKLTPAEALDMGLGDDDWCDDCDLPLEACCCPEASEFTTEDLQ